MVLPPPEEQLRIVLDMFDISTKVDMRGLDGVFMKLLIAHDEGAVDNLIEMLQLYNNASEVINSIIRYSREIPLADGTDMISI